MEVRRDMEARRRHVRDPENRRRRSEVSIRTLRRLWATDSDFRVRRLEAWRRTAANLDLRRKWSELARRQ